ncbi:MAG TPA: type 1 glutamine amidotransferase domain-containing protein [Chthoniobacteraceae bacterium]|nr:type 1 glutamine amidotransferase domain-containing protein [Chthoniobacteraceae bacterium]
MSTKLLNQRIAVLVTDGVEQSELEEPLKALRDEGADARIVSLKPGTIQAMEHADKGDRFPVDKTLDEVKADDFEALLIPGGLLNPDTLRSTRAAVDFVRDFSEADKPIAAICHGPWLLVEADIVENKRLTSWPAIQTDIRNAGGNWIDEPVVVDGRLVTSRKPDDIPFFNEKMIETFAKNGA